MKKKIILDSILNILATFIPIFSLQFIILPQVSYRIDAESYGQLISLVALINLFSSAFGSVLNNSRLIHYKKYDALNITGDYSIILIIYVISSIFLVLGSLLFYYHNIELGIVSVIMVIISSVLLLVNTYASVEFRINLNYMSILVSNICLLVGYVIGFLLFMITNQWIFIYFLGITISLLYIYRRTNILKEPVKKTSEFKTTFKHTNILFASGILVSLAVYIDKLLLFPLLGGTSVSVYYVATFIGKSITSAIGPITGVFLSYLAHYKSFSYKNFKKVLRIIGIVGIIGYFMIIIVSKPVLTIIYPQFVQEALQYVPVTTVSVMLNMMCNTINPIILRFTHVQWQFVINGSHILFYIFLTLFLQSSYGLIGFCVGIMFSQIIKLITMLVVYKINKPIIDGSTQNC